jgi:hypothetical protein
VNLPEPSKYKEEDFLEDDLYLRLTHGIGVDTDYYSKELEKVFAYERCELAPEFLGFTSTYKLLSRMIPLHFTVIDFGCNHACQSFYFNRHKKYIGVDWGIPVEHRLITPNSEHFMADGREFLNSTQGNDLLSKSFPIFAISNYVPSEDLNLLIRARFKDLYVFYPKSKMPTRPSKD